MDLTQLQDLATEPWVLAVAGAVALLLVVLVVLLLVRRARRRRALRQRYGAEYDHTARRTGSSRRADQHLLARERARREYQVRELEAGERERVRARWEAVQASFVDDPWAATRSADDLLVEVAEAKGYPVDAEHPLAGVSVDHPRTLDRYRKAARVLAERGGSGADTESMRRALLGARDLFDTLVGTTTTPGPGPTSAFRALVEDDEAPEADAVLHDESPPVRRRLTDDADRRRPDDVAPASGLPLYGPDGRPLWEDHADHGR